MFFFFFVILGIGAFGGEFVQYKIFGISIFYILIVALLISYTYYMMRNKYKLLLDNTLKSLLYFEIYALLMVVLSLTRINKLPSLIYNLSYIPRQAYYLLILPTLFLMKDDYYIKRIKKIINKYGQMIFYLIYIIQIIKNNFSLSVSSVFVLVAITLSLYSTRRTRNSLINMCLVIFTPISVGGELTNLIIRTIYVLVFIFRSYKIHIIKGMSIAFNFMLLIIFISPIIIPFISNFLDANSLWRIEYWSDEIFQSLKSGLLGVGYGTSYATSSFVGDINNVLSGPFAPTNEYSTIEKLFVVGPHNSYIALLFRLGILGVFLFINMIFKVKNSILNYNKKISSITIFSFFSSIVIIGVNVGLESPYYLLLFVFSIGFSIYDINVCKK